MKIELLQSKIHRGFVTDKDIEYEGSVTIGEDLLKASGMKKFQKVDIVDINNGSRFSTYIIVGKGNEICINGAAARLVEKNDRVIIISYCSIPDQEAVNHKAKVVLLGENNIIEKISYE